MTDSDKIQTKKLPAPMLAVVGNSGSGKTTFIEKLIPELIRHGLKIGTVKHDVHGFQMDIPGKDSWRHKQAGASTTVISSPFQIGMVKDVEHDYRPDELLPLFYNVDIILIEGYKRSRLPKLEVFRPEISSSPLCKDDESLLALISDTHIDLDVPRFSFEDIDGIVGFLIAHFNL